MMAVSAFSKGVEQGFEADFSALLGVRKRIDLAIRLLFEPLEFRHTDADQLFKTTHTLLKALFGASHRSFETTHAGFGGRLALCHTLQDGLDLVELLSNGLFHTQSILTWGSVIRNITAIPLVTRLLFPSAWI